ncbi:MAG: flagellar protein FlaG [Fidelibacterota bacterium]
MDTIQEVSPAPAGVKSEVVPEPSPVNLPPVNLPQGKITPTEEKKKSSESGGEKPRVNVKKLVKAYNDFARTIGTKLTFVQDSASGRMVILVKDQETGKVIRQIPSQEMLELLAKMKNLEGMLFNKEG